MKQKVLVVTNFSAASKNALSYACQLLGVDNYAFLLVHIYTLPLTYTYEGVALASVSASMRDIEEELGNEMERVRQQYPQIDIRGQYVIGGLVESAREIIAAQSPELLIFGTAGYYSELWHTDSELLVALRNLTIPVMIVPEHIVFQPVENIAFACDFKNICVPKQVDFIRQFVQQTKARLSVVHVTRSRPDDALMKENERNIQEALQAVHPRYFSIENPEVFKAIDGFITEHRIDLLIVIPRKHEFWYSLFHKSNVQQLAFLNRIPLLALPE